MLTYRPVTPADADLLVDLDSDPEVMRYISGGRPTPRAVIVERVIPRMQSFASRPGQGFFVVCEFEQPLGWAHLRPDILEPRWLEIGYRLFRHAWGRGVATEVACTLRDRALGELGCATVTARTLPDNRASRRVMEKAGLVYRGDFVFPARPDIGFSETPGVLYARDSRAG